MLQGLAGFWGKLHDGSVCLGLVGVFFTLPEAEAVPAGLPAGRRCLIFCPRPGAGSTAAMQPPRACLLCQALLPVSSDRMDAWGGG